MTHRITGFELCRRLIAMLGLETEFRLQLPHHRKRDGFRVIRQRFVGLTKPCLGVGQ